MTTLDELVYYCKEKNPFGAIMLTGKWGCGKTYLIDHELISTLGDEYIVIRISLFGKSSIEDIDNDIKKMYFEKLMLNLGSGVEQVVGKVSKISDEQATKMGKVVDDLSEKTEKVLKGKVGGFIKAVADLAGKVPGIDKIMSINPSDYVGIEPTIGEKKVILVFDDLERCDLDEVKVLGCINEYCENKHMKTIIVANEDVIINRTKRNIDEQVNEEENNKLDNKELRYSEVKEKIVTRTIMNIPNYEKIIEQILEEYKASDDYKYFLRYQKEIIIKIFYSGKSNNIRSVKCAIQDFERVFYQLNTEVTSEDLEKFLINFVAFMIMYKDGKICKHDRYGYIFAEEKIKKEYPQFYNSDYVLSSTRDWIIDGIWEKEEVSTEIKQFIEKRKAIDPKDIVKNNGLLYIDDIIMKQGFPKVLETAYAGELSFDEYIVLIENISLARYVGYSLPIDVEMDKLETGIKVAMDKLTDSDVADTRMRRMISSSNLELLSQTEKNYMV